MVSAVFFFKKENLRLLLKKHDNDLRLFLKR